MGDTCECTIGKRNLAIANRSRAPHHNSFQLNAMMHRNNRSPDVRPIDIVYANETVYST